MILANALAWPPAFYLTRSWLDQFSYRFELGSGLFLIGGGSAAAVAFLAALSVTFRASLRDPAEVLRAE